MNNSVFAAVTVLLLCSVLIFSLGSFHGERLEQNRLYERCLQENKVMIHEDLVLMCKDRVK